MFTIALYNKDIAPGAAVYVQDTKSWKFVKSFNEEPISERMSEVGIKVASSIPSLNVSPEELFELLGTIEKGLALYCDNAVAINAQAAQYAAAVPDAVRIMFQGCRTSTPHVGTGKHTVAVTHGGTRYVYNPDSGLWEFQPNSPVPDGMFEEINVQRSNYQFSCERFVALVLGYINTFPITSTGNIGTVYVMATC